MNELWTLFSENSDFSDVKHRPCGSESVLATQSSCTNHALIFFFDILLLTILLINIFFKRPNTSTDRSCQVSRLQLISAIYNGVLGLGYLCSGVLTLEEKWRRKQKIDLSWRLLGLFHGLTWLLVSLAVSLSVKHFSRAPLCILSLFAFIYAGGSFSLSSFAAIAHNKLGIIITSDALLFLGASLLLICTYKRLIHEENNGNGSDLYAPLDGDSGASGIKNDYAGLVTPLASAGFFSKMSFWWLNPLMRRGRMKTLQDEDIPKLRKEDQAETCYLLFMEHLDKQKAKDPSTQPSILRTIILCHQRDILFSGFFALLKLITISAGPLLLNAFIRVSEGKGSFEHEGYVLVLLLFFSKNLESLSQRQWYFRSRLIGVKIRSLLTAAIYKKQLRLSNAAKKMHSAGEIMNYVTVDAYRIGEFPFWFHQLWTTSLQLCFALVILYHAVGLATVASLAAIVLVVLSNAPLAKLQNKFQSKLMLAQDERLKFSSEALVNMKVLKLYAWETHFKNAIKQLRTVEYKWLSIVQLLKAYNSFLFWSSPVLVSAATFGACYFFGVPLHARNVFTFVATLRLVQDPVRCIPDLIGVVIQAKVALTRILNFLEAPELNTSKIQHDWNRENANCNIVIKSADLSWEENAVKPTLRNINLKVRVGEKVAICGEVGSGKSTLLAAILGEVPNINDGTMQVYGNIAYVPQSAWIQMGSIRENILFGSNLDYKKYQETLEKCSLVKDLELLPHGDLTEIGERGVNVSGGQKQRIQLARALYQDADIYLLDDPFSAVDAHTATSLFNDYVMYALSGKTVLLVTHQVDFLPAFDSVLLMSQGEILPAAPYHLLMASSRNFQDLVDAHKKIAGAERIAEINPSQDRESVYRDARRTHTEVKSNSGDDQLIKQEEREVGDAGLRPYIQYINQNKGLPLFLLVIISHFAFATSQILQNFWMAANIENPDVSTLSLILVYLVIGLTSTLFLFGRSLASVFSGLQSSKSMFSQLLESLFRAPMSFYDSTPLGRILSRVSTDLSIVDIDLPFSLMFTVTATTNAYSNIGVIAVVTWEVLFVAIPMVYVVVLLQRYYFSSAKELMRINGTTKSLVANHLAESLAGAMTIRAFKEDNRFFSKTLDLIDANASPYLHNFAANEWLIQRLETLGATVLSSSALCMVLLPPGTFSPGFIGMALSYGLSLNSSLVGSISNQCLLANHNISVERLKQYMHLPSEAPEVNIEKRPPINWPAVGKVDIQDLQIKYRPAAPLVLRGISCTFEGGDKIGIVGRTGSGKTTLIGALFRLVEPSRGKIVVDGIDISTIGLHDLRSRFGIIPQDPTLFNGTVRYNLDPLSQHTDQEIWEVLWKCQLRETVREKVAGLDSLVMEDGLNWSMGQRQLFCLGRALLRRSKVLVLDEATASIDNATDLILQNTIKTEFINCTVITVAHRIPTVMDCTMVLAISDGKLVEFDKPMHLMKKEGSLFGRLVKEYWSQYHSAESQFVEANSL